MQWRKTEKREISAISPRSRRRRGSAVSQLRSAPDRTTGRDQCGLRPDGRGPVTSHSSNRACRYARKSIDCVVCSAAICRATQRPPSPLQQLSSCCVRSIESCQAWLKMRVYCELLSLLNWCSRPCRHACSLKLVCTNNYIERGNVEIDFLSVAAGCRWWLFLM